MKSTIEAKTRQYLRKIGAQHLEDRINNFYHSYKSICPEPINDVFVTDTRKGDAPTEYGSLWFFSNSFAMESESFLTSISYDSVKITDRVSWWKIDTTDFSFSATNEDSRMTLGVNFIPHPLNTHLSASRQNCYYLSQIFEKYIRKNHIGNDIAPKTPATE